MNRRVVLQLLLAAWPARKQPLRIGLVTDIHHADKPTWRTRFYREALPRFREAVQRFASEKVAFAVMLGDFVDEAPTPAGELAYLRAANSVYAQFRGERHYVLGNHCVWTLTKEEFLRECRRARSHYSFDRQGLHFVVLDACFRRDGIAYGRRNFDWRDTCIPAEELEWLRRDLTASRRPIIVFVHQRLDDAGDYSVTNAAAVRAVLQDAGKVVAVFQGHSHRNDYTVIGGVHYVTLAAVVENAEPGGGAYGILEIGGSSGEITLTGFRQQQTRTLPQERAVPQQAVRPGSGFLAPGERSGAVGQKKSLSAS